jgi:hypothetical protein
MKCKYCLFDSKISDKDFLCTHKNNAPTFKSEDFEIEKVEESTRRAWVYLKPKILNQYVAATKPNLTFIGDHFGGTACLVPLSKESHTIIVFI